MTRASELEDQPHIWIVAINDGMLPIFALGGDLPADIAE
jgi:hypothetical protein